MDGATSPYVLVASFAAVSTAATAVYVYRAVPYRSLTPKSFLPPDAVPSAHVHDDAHDDHSNENAKKLMREARVASRRARLWRQALVFTGTTISATAAMHAAYAYDSETRFSDTSSAMDIVEALTYMAIPGMVAYMCNRYFSTADAAIDREDLTAPSIKVAEEGSSPWTSIVSNLKQPSLWLAVSIIPLCNVASGALSLAFPGVQYSASGEYLLTFARRMGLSVRDPKQFASIQAQLRSNNANVFGTIASGLFLSVLIAPFINFLPAIGEEAGWRGYLLPRLRKLGFGFWARSALTGFVWGLWHIPIILTGHNYPFHPRTGAVFFIFLCVLMSPIYTHFTEKIHKENAVTAALMHGAMNGSAQLGMFFLGGGSDLINGPAGLAGAIVYGGVNAGLAIARRNTVEEPIDLAD